MATLIVLYKNHMILDRLLPLLGSHVSNIANFSANDLISKYPSWICFHDVGKLTIERCCVIFFEVPSLDVQPIIFLKSWKKMGSSMFSLPKSFLRNLIKAKRFISTRGLVFLIHIQRLENVQTRLTAAKNDETEAIKDGEHLQ